VKPTGGEGEEHAAHIGGKGKFYGGADTAQMHKKKKENKEARVDGVYA